jgi:ARG/rhodanese/phosphatase superfamily protein
MSRVSSFYALGIVLGVIAVLVVATNRDATKPPASRGALPGDLVIGEPVVHENLTIFPVSSRAPRTQDRFITLDEGLASGKVEILEKGALAQSQPSGQSAGQESEANPPATGGGQAQVSEGQLPANQEPASQGNEVNELMVVNHSGRPLYLMPGEIIVGGDQDRTIGHEYVVAPDGKPVTLDVYCVEHGRWGGRAEAEYAGLRPFVISVIPVVSPSATETPETVAREVAAQANAGKFVGSVGSLSKNVRLAVQSGDGQGKVWDEVSMSNAKAGVQPQSGAFTANYADDESVKRLEPYIGKLQGPVAEIENVVGVIVAVNGKVESMDVFESTPLFKKLWPKLLKSHALDAANAAGVEVAGKACTRQDAVAFLTETAAAGTSNTETKGDIAVSRRESERVLVFSAHSWHEVRDPAAADADASAGGFGGGGLGGVHAAAFAK